MTLLPGVGGGFFDDQDPQALFNLGSAVVQPPTFAGTSGLGYAVTAGGNLVRFDLDDPAAGASVVYSGQQVVAAQALTSGQVVVALANGVVDLLVPQGNGLSVESQLLADRERRPRCPARSRWWPRPTASSMSWSAARAPTTSRSSPWEEPSRGGSDAVAGRCVVADAQSTFQPPAATPASSSS